MKRNKYQPKKKVKKNRFYFKDIYNHKHRLVFSKIRHIAKHKSQRFYPDSQQLKRINQIVDLIQEFEPDQLSIILSDYMKLFKIPHNNTMYYIVPIDCPIRKFKWAINKYKYIIKNEYTNIGQDKKNEVINNYQHNHLTYHNSKKVTKNNKDKKIIKPKIKNLETLNSSDTNVNLIEMPCNNIKPPVTKIKNDFGKGNLKPSSKYTSIYVMKRNQSITQQLKFFYENICQICDSQLDIGQDTFYSEVHHIQPIGKHNGPDIIENMIVLCPNHHIMFDKGSITIDLDNHVVFHVNEKHKLNGIPINIQHNIDPQYIEYYNLNIYKGKIIEHQQDLIVNYEDTVVFFDGDDLYEVILENYHNRYLMNNMQRMLLFKKLDEEFLFNENYYRIVEIKKPLK